MSQPDETLNLQLRPRPSTPITLAIPNDTLAMLERVAAHRDMSVDALLKLYIGQLLRQDAAQLWSERVLDLTAQVLTRHGQSQEQVEAILSEIRRASGA